MIFVKESLKFILFGFFKRCRIITEILLKIKKNFQNDSKQSIFADMLSSNMRWVFLTIRTCIDKVKDKVIRSRNHQERTSELFEPHEKWPIMGDLLPFEAIIQDIIDSLTQMTNAKTHQKDGKYYESTLQKLIEKLFQQGDNSDGEDGDDK